MTMKTVDFDELFGLLLAKARRKAPTVADVEKAIGRPMRPREHAARAKALRAAGWELVYGDDDMAEWKLVAR